MDTVILETSLGLLEIELDRKRAPLTTENFLQYVEDKFYDGTIFHRVIDDFMIQGGGFTDQMEQKKTRPPIKNEASPFGPKNLRGTISMARTNDPHSATAQFFINAENNYSLDADGASAGYAVFGRITENSLPVLDKIRSVKTTVRNGMRDVPVDVVHIISAYKKAN